MKKIITLFSLLVFTFSSVVVSAQTDKKTATKKAETKQETPAKKEESGPKLKKDGTPDMRYKENKEAAKKTGPTKKDGTPDMRYKENKTKK